MSGERLDGKVELKNADVESAIQALGGWLFAASAAINAVHVIRITSMSAQTAMSQVKRAQFMLKKRAPGPLKK